MSVPLAAASLFFACDPAPPRPAEPPAEWSDAWLDAQAARYLGDAGARRAALVESLANPENTYSRQRLDSYGLGDRRWDALPVWNPRSVAVSSALARPLASGSAPALPEGTRPLWDGRRPTRRSEWEALGREAFFRYPLRAEVFMEHGLARPAVLERFGVARAPDGSYPGLVVFADVDGRTRVGITCALCHSAARDGALVVGAARRSFDYGALRIAYHDETGVPVDPDLLRRMAGWGPGRADVTEDDDEDPVAIPDLWGVRAQSALTQAGTIRQTSPLALAIRQETQLLHSNHQKVRPPREVAWALAMYVYSLSPPPRRTSADAETARGEALFARGCKSCHSNAAYGGPPVEARRVGTDPALALGAARGTGMYRPPALLDVADAAPYFHHGAVPTLEDVLSPDRLLAEYAQSPLGPGPVPGHTYGLSWSGADRAAVVAFLRTL